MKRNLPSILYILPSKLTNNRKQNIKIIKRKLNIYNLKNNTNYKLNDFGLKILYNRITIFYYYKDINKWFCYNLLDTYKENFYKAFQFLIDNLEGCELYEKEDKDNINSIFLFKEDKFILQIDLKNNIFYLSYSLIWKELLEEYDYKWIEISSLCNSVLEDFFEKERYVTTKHSTVIRLLIEQDFKEGKFIKNIYL